MNLTENEQIEVVMLLPEHPTIMEYTVAVLQVLERRIRIAA